MRLSAKEGLRPLAIEQAVGLLSCSDITQESRSCGHEAIRLKSFTTVLDSPMVI